MPAQLVIVRSVDVGTEQLVAALFNDGAGGAFVVYSGVLDVHALAGLPMPHLCSLEEDEGVTFVVPQHSITRAKVSRVSGGVGHKRLELLVDGVAHPFTPGDLLLREDEPIDSLTAAAFKAAFGVVADGSGGLRPVWICDLGTDAYRGVREAQRLEREARRLERETRELTRLREELQRQEGVSFVNPYTFVPLPAKVVRVRPRGHLSLGPDGLSGHVDLRWEMVAPLLLAEPRWQDEQGRLHVPGSSVRGAVRALHEVLSGSCLRILDVDYAPAYRMPIAPPTAEDTLAVVASVDAFGAVTSVRVCDQVTHVRHETATEVLKRPAQSGDTLDIDRQLCDKVTALNRWHAREEAVTSGNEWVVLVTDTAARGKWKKSPGPDGERRPAGIWWACGHLTETTLPVQQAVWQQFLLASEDSHDNRQRRQWGERGNSLPPNDPGWRSAPVIAKVGSSVIGHRRLADGTLGVGDVVWVKKQGDAIAELRLASIWRRVPGTLKGESPAPVGARIGATPAELGAGPPIASALPCTDPQDLCPSCAVFGMAEARMQSSDDGAHVRAYASHVRFGPAVTPDPCETSTRVTAPLRSPHPGAGQFYLAPPPVGTRAAWGTVLAHWGNAGAGDGKAAVRPLRGRKFYWHGPSSRSDAVTGAAAVDDAHTLAPEGTVLTSRVWFDNLDRRQLSLLVAACAPTLVLMDVDGGRRDHTDAPVLAGRRFASHLGGGRPLGFGSATTSIVEGSLTLYDATRYGAGQGALSQGPIDLESLLALCTYDASDPSHSSWPGLASVLDMARVPADRISYPPNPSTTWSQERTVTFRESYRWFKVSAGGGQGAPATMTPLPLVTDAVQLLPINPVQAGQAR